MKFGDPSVVVSKVLTPWPIDGELVVRGVDLDCFGTEEATNPAVIWQEVELAFQGSIGARVSLSAWRLQD